VAKIRELANERREFGLQFLIPMLRTAPSEF